MHCVRTLGRHTAVLLMAVIAFTFVHSELDVLVHTDDDHVSHDYCDLLKSAPAIQKVVKQGFVNDLVPLTTLCTEDPARPAHVVLRTLPSVTAGLCLPGLHIRYRTLLI